jgi:hypothetical protein
MTGWPTPGYGVVDERPPTGDAIPPGAGEEGGPGFPEPGENAGRDDLAAYRRARRRARTRRLATGAAGLIGLAVVWQVAATIIRDPVFLPSATQTVRTFWHYLDRPYPSQGSPLWYDCGTTRSPACAAS